MGGSGLIGFLQTWVERKATQDYERFWELARAASDTRDMPR